MIVSTTMVYPHPARPTHGIFVERRLRAIADHMPVQVIAPVPWFPVVRPLDGRAVREDGRVPPVLRPPMLYVPGLLKTSDPDFYARALRAGLKEIGGGPVDVIDAHFVWPDGVGAWRVARERGVPFVCTLRGKLVSQSRYPARRRMIAEMLRDADALIAVSRSLAEMACDVAERDLAVHVIPNGIERETFRRTAVAADEPDAGLREAFGWPNAARVAVCVGHYQALKAFDVLVDLWPEVRRRGGDARLVLVGGPAGEPVYEKRLRQAVEDVNRRAMRSGNGVAPVALLGPQPAETIARLLNAADLFVLASRSEGWCNAIAEALACGCPVVATDVGGNRELVRGGQLGRLVAPGDRAAMIEAIVFGLGETWNREGIAREGGRRDWRQVGGECAAVLRAAAGGRDR